MLRLQLVPKVFVNFFFATGLFGWVGGLGGRLMRCVLEAWLITPGAIRDFTGDDTRPNGNGVGRGMIGKRRSRVALVTQLPIDQDLFLMLM